MKKLLLPIIILFLCIQFLCIPVRVSAAAPTGTPSASTTSTEGSWQPDSDVTFAGKVSSRSASLVNWTLTNYKWAYSDNALIDFWSKIRNIVYVLILLVVLGAAFTLIVTGGGNLTTLILVRKFILVLLLITFSFALLRFLYELTDVIQGFFLYNSNGTIISSKDLLNISFDYTNFTGFRKIGPTYEESAFISLLLVRLTAITYYLMAGILLVRKIILWFFIAVSPIYPLILLYFPLRNTAKIWISEFFRWLLYAPLFAIFLSSLVTLWKNSILILPFHFTQDNIYPTAINILLGGPGQQVAYANSINNNDSFAQYVVALIMLWVVIFLPFLLLQILLDYVSSIPIDRTTTVNYLDRIMKKIPGGNLVFPGKPPIMPEPQPPAGTRPEGAAKALPFMRADRANRAHDFTSQMTNRYNESHTSTQHISHIANTTNTALTSNKHLTESYETSGKQQQSSLSASRFSHMILPRFKQELTTANRETVHLAHLTIPTMMDIARFETARLSRSQMQHQEIAKVHETLEKIAKPDTITSSSTEREEYMSVKQKLSEAKGQGDPVAKSILSAASAVAPSLQTPAPSFPVTNQVQIVSVEDYEAVRQVWEDNYDHMDPPAQQTRESWIQHEATMIEQTVTLLTSTDPLQTQKGMAAVSHILPFLLIGGFSQTEVITYLKAKLAAGKASLKKLAEKQNEEDTLLELQKKQARNQAQQTTAASVSRDEDTDINSNTQKKE